MVSGNPNKRVPFAARRVALLASVAAVGGMLLLGGPGGFDHMSFASQSAQAAEPVRASDAQHPVGFADLVAKVKPAVISVRVKIDRTAETTGSGGGNGNGNVIPFQPGGPLDK